MTHLGKLFSEQISCFLFLLKGLLTSCDQLVHPGHLQAEFGLALFQAFNFLIKEQTMLVLAEELVTLVVIWSLPGQASAFPLIHCQTSQPGSFPSLSWQPHGQSTEIVVAEVFLASANEAWV